MRADAFSIEEESSVPIRCIARSNPQPAAVLRACFINVLKKPLFHGFETLAVFVDGLRVGGKTLVRFVHNALIVMIGFSDAGSATTGPRYDFAATA